jgi:hypothetical protein
MQSPGKNKPGDNSKRRVSRGRSESRDQDPFLPADLINKGSVDEKGEGISECAGSEDNPEVFVGDARAEGVFCHREIVTSHVEERVSHPERKPVRETSAQKPRAMAERVIVEVKSDYYRETDGNNAQGHKKGAFSRVACIAFFILFGYRESKPFPSHDQIKIIAHHAWSDGITFSCRFP